MAFSFIHTADWQIDKPFANLPADRASLLRQARLDVVERIAAIARDRGIGHVLIAGDVFDSGSAPVEVGRRLMAALKSHPHITWHLLPGNHDPAQARSIWERIATAAIPPNVKLCLTSAIVEIAPGVALLPAPLAQKAMATDPTAWMDQARTEPGVIRIGLAHGSVQGFGSSGDGDAAVPIAPDRDRAARLDYLALGDWHGTVRISDRTWYSGTPETDRFPDNEPGHVLAVTIDGAGAAPRVERIETTVHRWSKRAMTLGAIDRFAPLRADLAALGLAKSKLLLELMIDGRVSLEDHAALTAAIEELRSEVFWLVVKNKNLQVSAGADDMAKLGDGPLRSAAERLKVLADANGEEAATARRALSKLFEFANADGRAS